MYKKKRKKVALDTIIINCYYYSITIETVQSFKRPDEAAFAMPNGRAASVGTVPPGKYASTRCGI